MARPEATGKKILSYADLKDKGIRFSEQWLRKLMAAGKFPKPINLGAQSRGFLESEIDDWIADRVRQRDQAAG